MADWAAWIGPRAVSVLSGAATVAAGLGGAIVGGAIGRGIGHYVGYPNAGMVIGAVAGVAVGVAFGAAAIAAAPLTVGILAVGAVVVAGAYLLSEIPTAAESEQNRDVERQRQLLQRTLAPDQALDGQSVDIATLQARQSRGETLSVAEQERLQTARRQDTEPLPEGTTGSNEPLGVNVSVVQQSSGRRFLQLRSSTPLRVGDIRLRDDLNPAGRNTARPIASPHTQVLDGGRTVLIPADVVHTGDRPDRRIIVTNGNGTGEVTITDGTRQQLRAAPP